MGCLASQPDNYLTITVAHPPGKICPVELKIISVTQLGSDTPCNLPPDNGSLEKKSDTEWRYFAWVEPKGHLHPRRMVVKIEAMIDGQSHSNALEFSVGTVWQNIGDKGLGSECAYTFIRWKYATVLATTGGGFSSVTFLGTPYGTCGGGGAVACTNCFFGGVKFGTATFGDTENVAASYIGHELMHTPDSNSPHSCFECPAYTWEFDHFEGTGMNSSDNAANKNEVITKKNEACD